jgi:hypothetical protein
VPRRMSVHVAAPGRKIGPAAHGLARPGSGLVGVTARAGVRTLKSSVSLGLMKAKVWLRTFTFAMVCSIFGIWHATQSLPALPRAWCVWSSSVAACGPFGDVGP